MCLLGPRRKSAAEVSWKERSTPRRKTGKLHQFKDDAADAPNVDGKTVLLFQKADFRGSVLTGAYRG